MSRGWRWSDSSSGLKTQTLSQTFFVKDVVIVGSGPAGYTAALYAARAGLNPVVIAGSIDAGGALMNTTEVENYPGFPEGIQGPDLMDKFQEQAEKFGAEIVFDDVEEVDFTSDLKKLVTSEGVEYSAKTVILAMGAAHRHLGVPGETELTGKGVSTCATCDGFFQRGKRVAVVGGGDSALEEATFLARLASHVTIIHRRDAFRASKAMVDRLERFTNIDVLWETVVDSFDGGDKLTAVSVTTKDKGRGVVLVEGAFVAIGHDPRSQLVSGLVEVDDEGYVKVFNGTTETSGPGVFACGDLVDKRYRQAITAAGSGCAAALDAQKHLESN